MADRGSDDVALRRLTLAATIVITGTVVVTAAIYERTRVQWWRLVHPLATPRATLDRTRAGLQDKRSNLLMAAAAAASVFEVARVVGKATDHR
jgi:hypothetical protein